MSRPPGLAVMRAPADFDDWQGLHAFLLRAFAFMHGRIDPPSSLLAMSADDLADKAGGEILFLAMSGGAVVGCLFLKHRDTAGYVGKLAVDAAWRGRGLARELLALAEDSARTAGKRALVLQTRVELVENHATFARLGFVVTAHTAHDGYERPTSVTMERPIDLESGNHAMTALTCTEITRHFSAADATITLDETARHRRRMMLTSDRLPTGATIAFLLDLPQARLLRHGDGLKLSDGRIVEVRAAPEALMEVRGRNPRHLVALAWQIGNRHLAAEISADAIRIRTDHVIRAMLEGLGATVTDISAPFDPEGGAYGGHGRTAPAHSGHAHAHGHADGHGDAHAGHAHAHDHDYSHDHHHHHD